LRICEELVGEDDELSHEGGESEFFCFAASEETEVERSEDRVVAGGDERGHVKDGADLRAAAEDVALPAELAAVVVKWSDAGEGGGLGIGPRSDYHASTGQRQGIYRQCRGNSMDRNDRGRGH
jgi:hypothetical protein